MHTMLDASSSRTFPHPWSLERVNKVTINSIDSLRHRLTLILDAGYQENESDEKNTYFVDVVFRDMLPGQVCAHVLRFVNVCLLSSGNQAREMCSNRTCKSSATEGLYVKILCHLWDEGRCCTVRCMEIRRTRSGILRINFL